MQLPPKRFQSDSDPKYDNLRHLPWFKNLSERRKKIAILRVAATECESTDASVKAVCTFFNVDERELRDFIDFQTGRSRFAELEPPGLRKAFQQLLDQAYDVFRDTSGARPLSNIINEQARFFGVSPRHVIELWEIDPNWYPLHYRGIK